jgi:hypothetical protein
MPLKRRETNCGRCNPLKIALRPKTPVIAWLAEAAVGADGKSMAEGGAFLVSSVSSRGAARKSEKTFCYLSE